MNKYFFAISVFSLQINGRGRVSRIKQLFSFSFRRSNTKFACTSLIHDDVAKLERKDQVLVKVLSNWFMVSLRKSISNEFKNFFANKQTLDKNTHLNKTKSRCFTKFWLTIQKFNNLPYYFVFESVKKFQCLIESREPHVKSYKNIFQFMVDPRNLLEIFLILHFEKLMCHLPAKTPRNVFFWKNDCVTNPRTTRESFFVLHFEK